MDQAVRDPAMLRDRATGGIRVVKVNDLETLVQSAARDWVLQLDLRAG